MPVLTTHQSVAIDGLRTSAHPIVLDDVGKNIIVCNGTACFVAGTLVQTSIGLKAIETFVGGELVWARNDQTLDYGYRPVIATKATPNQPLYEVVVSNNEQTETYYTTAEHPFWIKDHGWRKASLLEAGMVLLDRHNQPLEVISQQLTNDLDTVFNIQVQDSETYHIGKLGVWVHNAKCCEVGSYKDLKSTEIVGDGLEHDHIPSWGALKAAKEQQIGRPLSASEAKTLYDDATAVEIPRDIHKAGRTYGGKNSNNIAKDAQDLCNAIICDTIVLQQNLLDRGYDPKLVRQTIDAIIKRNKDIGVIK